LPTESHGRTSNLTIADRTENCL